VAGIGDASKGGGESGETVPFSVVVSLKHHRLNGEDIRSVGRHITSQVSSTKSVVVDKEVGRDGIHLSQGELSVDGLEEHTAKNNLFRVIIRVRVEVLNKDNAGARNLSVGDESGKRHSEVTLVCLTGELDLEIEVPETLILVVAALIGKHAVASGLRDTAGLTLSNYGKQVAEVLV
jgi:hypothetical protein